MAVTQGAASVRRRNVVTGHQEERGPGPAGFPDGARALHQAPAFALADPAGSQGADYSQFFAGQFFQDRSSQRIDHPTPVLLVFSNIQSGAAT